MKDNKFVAITGVCGGIGFALAKEFIRKGYNIIGIDINNDRLESIKTEFSDCFYPYYANLMTRDERLAISNKIFSDLGVPDIWFNNAGIAYIDSFLNTPVKDFDNVIELNLLSYIDLTRYWLDKMVNERQGTIVNIASCAGHMSAPNFSSYNASKFAVVGLTEAIQQELKIQNSSVKMVMVSPGFVKTEIVKLGQERGFPEKLSFILESAESCAKEIVEGVLKGKEFINPTLNGKILMGLNKISPDLFKLSSKLIFTLK
jgi:short-subunit dehydrogenase